MRVSVAVAVCALLAGLLAPAVAEVSRSYGVQPSRKSHYESGTDFTCVDGSIRIPAWAVNDDYCDCGDGSDEPGTSACNNGVFYCANKGHVAAFMPTSRVNDGVCDCCDGTDEYKDTKCANTCEEAGREERERKARLQREAKEGVAKRAELVTLGQSIHSEAEREIAALRAEVEALVAAEANLEAAKANAETEENNARAQIDIEFSEASRMANEARVTKLFDFLDLDKDGVIIANELMRQPKFDLDNNGEVTYEEITEVLDKDGNGALEENEKEIRLADFTGNIYNDLADAMKGVEEVTVPEPVKNEYDEDTKKAIAAADAAREALTNAQKSRTQKEDAIDARQKKLDIDAGEKKEWLSSHGQCYDITDREYVYKLCPFEKVTQEQKQGGRSTSLGRWKGWNGQPNKYTGMLFEGGEACWNGPARSCKVTVECGVKNEVVSVSEPNRCEYAMTFKSPAVCQETSGHDEL